LTSAAKTWGTRKGAGAANIYRAQKKGATPEKLVQKKKKAGAGNLQAADKT